MYKLVENRSEKGKELRVAVVESIQELIKENDKVVAMEADWVELVSSQISKNQIRKISFNVVFLKQI